MIHKTKNSSIKVLPESFSAPCPEIALQNTNNKKSMSFHFNLKLCSKRIPANKNQPFTKLVSG
jgi:hypothetical protein